MTVLVWDEVGSKKFEAALDRGVLYLEDCSGVVWNGLASISEKTSINVEPVYWDGRKFNDIVTLGEYSATLFAFTYPEEFQDYQGILDIANGFHLLDQRLKRFGLSYRTMIGDDVLSINKGYKIHVVYNLMALISDIDHDSLSDSVEAIKFEWELTSVPIDVAGYEPTSHFILDTTNAPSGLVTAVEGKLYGNLTVNASLPPLSYFLNLATQDW